MKIVGVKSLTIPAIKVIRFERIRDGRGFFTEIYKSSDFQHKKELSFLENTPIMQINESHSKKNTIRGLHIQVNPPMGKLIRTVKGHMIDLALDLQKTTETFGKIIAYDMPANLEEEFDQWIWIPPGFAHGNYYLEESSIEYLCTSEYNPAGEIGISPLAPDIDWSLVSISLKSQFNQLVANNPLLSSKDREGLTLTKWKKIGL